MHWVLFLLANTHRCLYICETTQRGKYIYISGHSFFSCVFCVYMTWQGISFYSIGCVPFRPSVSIGINTSSFFIIQYSFASLFFPSSDHYFYLLIPQKYVHVQYCAYFGRSYGCCLLLGNDKCH